MDDLSSRYQLPENLAGAGEVEVDAELIDFATGLELIDPDDQEQLTGETFSDIILADRPGYCFSCCC